MMMVPYSGSPIGTLTMVFSKNGLTGLLFDDDPRFDRITNQENQDETQDASVMRGSVLMQDWLTRYFNGDFCGLPVKTDPSGTDFQKLVWSLLLRIPPGETRTYQQIAVAAGRPTACRAVANAIAANPILIAVPCHRVIGSDGGLGGFRAGMDRKKFLLNLEKADGIGTSHGV